MAPYTVMTTVHLEIVQEGSVQFSAVQYSTVQHGIA